MARPDGRTIDQLRPVKITRNFIKYPEGSVLIETGDTKVICNASVESRVPNWLYGSGQGWVTAEYSLLPRSTQSRSIREAARGKVSGRTHEIQRLIGRSLRSVVQLDRLGERTIWVDCDVIQADGGTRTASITGGFIALVDALDFLVRTGELEAIPLIDFVAATSVGIVGGDALLDLNYIEDSNAQVDMNCVLTGTGKLVEIQGTGEEFPFSVEGLEDLLLLAQLGGQQLVEIQKNALGELGERVERLAERHAEGMAETRGGSR